MEQKMTANNSQIKAPEVKYPETVVGCYLDKNDNLVHRPIVDGECPIGHINFEGDLGDNVPDMISIDMNRQEIHVTFTNNMDIVIDSIRQDQMPLFEKIKQEFQTEGQAMSSVKPTMDLNTLDHNDKPVPGKCHIVDMKFI
jgi:hypothetical protein